MFSLYKYMGICFLLYNLSLFAAAHSNGSSVSTGSPVGSLVRKSSSPMDIAPTVSFPPDSPPQHTVLNLGAVGRAQSNSSIASQLSARYRDQLDKISPITTVDSARLKEEFDHDVGKYLPIVPPTEVATVLLTSSMGAQPSSSDDDSDGSSSSKSDPSYVKKLEDLIEGQERQLRVLTNIGLHNQVHWEHERQQTALNEERSQQERATLEADRNSQRTDKIISYVLTFVSLVAGTVLGLYPVIDKAVNGC